MIKVKQKWSYAMAHSVHLLSECVENWSMPGHPWNYISYERCQSRSGSRLWRSTCRSGCCQWYFFMWTDIFHVIALVVVEIEVIIIGITKGCTKTAESCHRSIWVNIMRTLRILCVLSWGIVTTAAADHTAWRRRRHSYANWICVFKVLCTRKAEKKTSDRLISLIKRLDFVIEDIIAETIRELETRFSTL